MEEQANQQSNSQQPNTQSQNFRQGIQQKDIAVFDNFNAAQKAKDLLQRSDVSLRNLNIDGVINPYEQVTAMGTTVGAQAGIFIGLFYGGVLGILFVAFYSTLVNGGVFVNAFNQLTIVVFAIAGAVFGAIAGKGLRNASLPEQLSKGNPKVPQRFKLTVEGSPDNISRAEEMLVERPS